MYDGKYEEEQSTIMIRDSTIIIESTTGIDKPFILYRIWNRK